MKMGESILYNGNKVFFVVVLVFTLVSCVPEDSNLEIVAKNLDTIWGIDFLPSGDIIFTERKGRVSVISDGNVIIVGNLEVSEVSESGLAGIAVDPDFDTNKFIYLYYTHIGGNRLSRFKLGDTLEDETILLDNIPSARFHDGGRVKFGPDEKLYITTGDATEPSSAQDINSLAGKILRINKDGSIPVDNPFDNYVYTLGHRNPQGIAWNSIGVMYESEHGPTRNDEINIIKQGKNYGWPDVQCTEISGVYENAIRCYDEFTIAPAGIAFHKNNLYVSGLRGSQVRKLTIMNGKVTSEEEFLGALGRVRNVVVHKNYIYIATSNRDGRGVPRVNDDRILRLKLDMLEESEECTAKQMIKFPLKKRQL